MGTITFSRAVRYGRRWYAWKTKPIVFRRKSARPSAGSAERSAPSIRTAPSVGTWSPPRIVSSVLFPAPDSPVMTTYSPGRMSKEIPPRAVARVPLPP